MSMNLRTLACCLMLVALVASGASAETLELNPGGPGMEAQDLDFGLVDGMGDLLVIWTDNKTLVWEAGSHLWTTPGFPLNMNYSGVLLDSNLQEIPNTNFTGQTPSENDPFPIGSIELLERTEWSGMRSSFGAQAVDIDWQWDNQDRPLVDVAVPVEEMTWGSIKALYWQ